jgi:branched-chain amino acid transport system ATP-binding protein
MLRIDNLVCRYGKVEAVKGITLEIENGQLVALIGANGAGKSTTLRTISGILPPASGRITLDGQDITKCTARQILGFGIAHCPRHRALSRRPSCLSGHDRERKSRYGRISAD